METNSSVPQVIRKLIMKQLMPALFVVSALMSSSFAMAEETAAAPAAPVAQSQPVQAKVVKKHHKVKHVKAQTGQAAKAK